MSSTDTLYTILGVSESATLEEIKRAYQRLMRAYHPDAVGADGDSTMAKRINDAYTTLSNENKRTVYNADLRQERGATPTTVSGNGSSKTTKTRAKAQPKPEPAAEFIPEPAYVPATDRYSFDNVASRNWPRVHKVYAELDYKWSRVWMRVLIGTVISTIIATLGAGWVIFFYHQVVWERLYQESQLIPLWFFWGFGLATFVWKRWHIIALIALWFGGILWPLSWVHFVIWPGLFNDAGWRMMAMMTVIAAAATVFNLAKPRMVEHWGLRPAVTHVADFRP